MRFLLSPWLLSLVILGSSLTAFGPWGLLWACLLVPFALLFRRFPVLSLVVILICLVLVGEPIFLTMERHDVRQAICRSNMHTIAQALIGYHSMFKCFPPAYMADSQGKPMHSWRVLILPFLDRPDLYGMYKFNEPWDGRGNGKLGALKVFVCPSDRSADPNHINYFAVVGPQTVWPGNESCALDEIKDGTADTIMLVETANSDIQWSEPRDLTLEDVLQGVNPPPGKGLTSYHTLSPGFFYEDETVVNVAFVNGQQSVLYQNISPEKLKALLTKAGGDDADLKHYDPLPSKLNWRRVIALPILVLSFILLLFRGIGKTGKQQSQTESADNAEKTIDV
jgi:hypothetical protein